MSNEEKKENLFAKGWNDFVSGLQSGFGKFQKGLEEQSKKNVENWDEAKDKVGKFFTKMKTNWDTQVQKWGEGMEKFNQQNKEQWDAGLQKVQDDYNKWQDNVREDWKDGIKAWNRGIYKGIFMFLIILIILLGGLFAVAYIFTMMMGAMP